MMGPTDLAGHAGRWLVQPGPEADVVFSTRIRLARNVEGFPFPAHIAPHQKQGLEQRLHDWIVASDLGEALQYCNLRTLGDLDRQILKERHLISRELMEGAGDRGVCYSDSERVSVMTNEEDHLRLQVVCPGLALDETLQLALDMDRRLEETVPYAFSERYGFITACPTNCGTGLRVSVMMHVPALVLAEQMEKVYKSASKVGLTVRGFYGEGSQANGDVVQISNQHTLGRNEDEILETMRNIVPKVVEFERAVRRKLLEDNRVLLEDKIWRALGLLRYARRLSSSEALDLLSAVRLGVNMDLIPEIGLRDVNELFVMTQPAHLQVLMGLELSVGDRDQARARLLRDRFRPESN